MTKFPTRSRSRKSNQEAAQAKIAKQAKAGCLALKIQGDIAGLTTYTTRRGLAVFYLQAPPKEPVSVDQAYFRAIFSAAIAQWRLMSISQREQWSLACRRAKLRLGPTALIVASQMPGQLPCIRTIEQQTATTLIDTEGNIVL